MDSANLPTTLEVCLLNRARTERVENLSDEIGRLSAHLNAAGCRLLELIAEFDALDGWSDQGAKTCAHWLNWKCGYGLNAAREKVRVARALGDLPKIHASYASGRISYSKVRAMTRVATPDNEDYLLHIALNGTASHVEKLVRSYRWRIDTERERADEQVRQDGRHVETWWDEDGCLIVRARLPAEQGALFLQALEAGRETVENDVTAETSEPVPQVNDAPRYDVTAVTQEHPPQGNDALRDAVTAATSPAPDWTEARPRHRADALVLMAESFLSTGPQAMAGGDKYQLLVSVEERILKDPGGTGCCGILDGPAMPRDTVRRIGCDSALRALTLDASGEPISIGRKSRTIPPAMRQAMLRRDGGCRFPGCNQRRNVHGHHIRHWADGGETSLVNLITLCTHHHRLVHEGGFCVRRIGPNRFAFTAPDGRPIPEVAPPALRVRDVDDSVRRWNRDLDVSIDVDTGLTDWLGEPMDYSEAVIQLQRRDRGRSAPPAQGCSRKSCQSLQVAGSSNSP